MSLDFPAAGYALWSIYDAGGPRPEYVIPSLSEESGLNPSLPNSQGYPYYGLNQVSGNFLAAHGVDPQDYLTWPASKQLSQIVKPYILSQVASYGPIRSATRMEQANFLPATLETATGLDSIVSRKGDPYYGPNATLDTNHSGAITVQDLANVMAKQAAKSSVQNAIQKTYSLRPNETPRDPVYGDDFGGNLIAEMGVLGTLFSPAGLLVALGISLVALYSEGYLDRPLDRVRRFFGA